MTKAWCGQQRWQQVRPAMARSWPPEGALWQVVRHQSGSAAAGRNSTWATERVLARGEAELFIQELI